MEAGRTGFITGTGSARAAALAPPAPALAPALTHSAVQAAPPRAVSAPSLAPLPQRMFDGIRELADGGFGKPLDKVVVLFRADLRLHDHPALNHALEEANGVIPVYVFDTRHFGHTSFGFEKTGKYRAKFLIESVKALRASLRSRGSDLVVRTGLPEEIVPVICKSTGTKHVFTHKEITHDEQNVEHALAAKMKELDGSLKTFWSNTLYYEDDLPFALDDTPDVYSEFRDAVLQRAQVRDPLPAPESVPAIPRGLTPGDVPTLKHLGIADVATEITPTYSGVGSIHGGEDEALRRVEIYVGDRTSSGREIPAGVPGSNGRSPTPRTVPYLGADFSCRISPWLALGCISPRRIYLEMQNVAKRPEDCRRSYTFLELVWRDFFRYITSKYSAQIAGKKNTVKAGSLVGA